jgi:hypothetical protein
LRTNYGRADGVVLEPLTVYSNSTEMLHAEQMVQLGSPVRWLESDSSTPALVNSSDLSLQSALLLHRTDSGQLKSARLERLEPGEKKSVVWQSADLQSATALWNDSLLTQNLQPTSSELRQLEGIWVGGLLNQIAQNVPLPPGSIVLIGLADQRLGALKIQPAQDQFDGNCLVVAHLKQPPLGSVMPDRNIFSRGSSND